MLSQRAQGHVAEARYHLPSVCQVLADCEKDARSLALTGRSLVDSEATGYWADAALRVRAAITACRRQLQARKRFSCWRSRSISAGITMAPGKAVVRAPLQPARVKCQIGPCHAYCHPAAVFWGPCMRCQMPQHARGREPVPCRGSVVHQQPSARSQDLCSLGFYLTC